MGAIWNTGEIGTKLSLLHLILLCESFYVIMLIPSIVVQSTKLILSHSFPHELHFLFDCQLMFHVVFCKEMSAYIIQTL